MSKVSFVKYSILFLIIVGVKPYVSAQSSINLDSVQEPSSYENIHIQKLFSDKNASSFLIFVKKEVKLHKHLHHSETIYIMEGSGRMILGNQTIDVKKGDLIFVPENTAHSVLVTSDIPLKVISNQAPEFDGKDRVILE